MRSIIISVILAIVLVESAAYGAEVRKVYRYKEWAISYLIPREFEGAKDATVEHREFRGFNEMGEGNGAMIYDTMWVARRGFASWAPGTGGINLVPIPEGSSTPESLEKHFVQRAESATVKAEAREVQMSSGTWIRIDRRNKGPTHELEGVLFLRIVGDDAVMIIAAGKLDPDKDWPERLTRKIVPSMERIAESIRIEKSGSDKTKT